MNPTQADLWRSEVLDRILVAMAGDAALRKAVVFKGARVLAHRLGRPHRQSLDLDGNLSAVFAAAHPDHDERCAWLQSALRRAISDAFEHDEPVRFTLREARVTVNPSDGHP